MRAFSVYSGLSKNWRKHQINVSNLFSEDSSAKLKISIEFSIQGIIPVVAGGYVIEYGSKIKNYLRFLDTLEFQESII